MHFALQKSISLFARLGIVLRLRRNSSQSTHLLIAVKGKFDQSNDLGSVAPRVRGAIGICAAECTGCINITQYLTRMATRTLIWKAMQIMLPPKYYF
jgi:hypothetical protein